MLKLHSVVVALAAFPWFWMLVNHCCELLVLSALRSLRQL